MRERAVVAEMLRWLWSWLRLLQLWPWLRLRRAERARGGGRENREHVESRVGRAEQREREREQRERERE